MLFTPPSPLIPIYHQPSRIENVFTTFLPICRLTLASGAANELLNDPFCFIQTSDGKVVSVQHKPNENISATNFKKGIAAAFQANFKRTTKEIEKILNPSILHITGKVIEVLNYEGV